MQLSLSNIINVSVSESQTGLGEYNTSNLAIFSDETPIDSWSTSFRIYKTASDVATDFGTTSRTAKMATSVFSQSPNILSADGSLVVIPMLKNIVAVTAIQHLTFTSIPTVGTYKLGYNGNYTTALAFGASNSDVQAALRLLTGLGSITVTGDTTAGFVVTFTGVTGPALLLTVSENSLQDASGFDVFVSSATTQVGVAAQAVEKPVDTLLRTKGLVQYFGLICSSEILDADVLLLAAQVQTLKKIAFVSKKLASDFAIGGIAAQITAAKYTHTRILGYIDTEEKSVLMASAYAGRALSVDFSGSNTTSTIHMKDLVGVVADPAMTETILTDCKTYGVDVYASFQGVAKVFCSGANYFFDRIYNSLWFVGEIEVHGFNYLATTNTKIPQTETGMDGLKGAYREVCEIGKTNQYIAQGTWTSPDTFGNKADFERNIEEKGYYIYSIPVNQQSSVDREARKAPLIQIAIKEAGAIHSSNVIININA